MPDDLEWQLCERHGLRIGSLRALTDVLQGDLSVEDWGYRQLSDLTDVEQRALISDQLIASVLGVRTNVMELALSLADYHDLTAAGIRMPRRDRWMEDFEHHLRTEMTQVAVFRAIGSVLDCMAAVAIVILRLPRAPTYADVRDLALIQDKAATYAQGTRAHNALVAAAAVIETRLTTALQWSLEMRNAVIHRGRQISFLLPRHDAGRLAIVTNEPMQLARERAQADLYFHRRPWLPEMDHLADTQAGIRGQWVNEPAQFTLQGLRDDLIDLINELGEALQNAWTGAGADGELPAPTDKWVLRQPPSIEFAGYAPEPAYAPLSQIHTNPDTAVRIQIAEQLRRHRC
jgi:hypothetical protein